MKEKLQLFWIDLEMTGLDVESDYILEIASLITNDNLEIIVQGPRLVIKQDEKVLNSMDTWNKEQHEKSGLLKEVRASGVSLEEATNQTFGFLKNNVSEKEGLLCGNSVYQDRRFLKKFMPKLVDYLYYRMIDVSSIKELIRRWYPNLPEAFFIKEDKHRAKEDIYDSLKELKYYREKFFI